MSPLHPGTPAPPIALPDTDGRPQALGSELTCLYFYKLECPTSALVMPVVNRLQRAYPQVRFLGIAQDEAEETRAWAARLGATFPQLVEPAPYATSESYGLEFTPTTFVLQAGRVERAVVAWNRDAFNALSATLAEALGQPCVTVSDEGDGLPPHRFG